ncbi:MAG: hypothetical protein FVQ82_11770 [Planctomycetes bacterium]|nr:hypothetical protein [Planctomycetota bacterium]
MGGEQINKEQYTGKITSGIKLRTFQLTIISFICQQLPSWRDDPDRPNEQSENKLNLQLCKFLNSHASNDLPMIRFNHEEYQTGRRQADMSASPAKSIFLEAKPYTIYDPVLVIECKRLPAHSSSPEKEYVTSPTPEKISGGIQRFKLGLHGAKLDLAVIIGYVQDHSARYWHKKIDGWILELVSNQIGDGCSWTVNETLKPLKEDKTKGVANCCSLHHRTYGNKIELHHLWIAMNRE